MANASALPPPPALVQAQVHSVRSTAIAAPSPFGSNSALYAYTPLSAQAMSYTAPPALSPPPGYRQPSGQLRVVPTQVSQQSMKGQVMMSSSLAPAATATSDTDAGSKKSKKKGKKKVREHDFCCC
eukprot:TRINITY_DN41908_c0_g1_i1.p1 TRINITY_DN41908_c0_g1~~TRINITY_DN41908_c0_g1_i1.p1  ORF type:complete len:126 (+),score=15.81 TRINITY_DN41908_c0_g1_i1:82-459(+)